MVTEQNQQENSNTIQRGIAYAFFLLSVTVITNIIIYYYTWHEHKYQNLLKLELQHNLIKSLIVDNLNVFQILNRDQNNSISNQILIVKEYIKNHVFINKSSTSNNHDNNLPYITLQELLNELSNQTFYYIITINNQQIISNGVDYFNNSLTKQYSITKDLLFTIKIQINPNSHYEQLAITQVNNQILLIIIESCVIFLLSTIIIFYLLNKNRKIQIKLKLLELTLNNSITRNKNILLFHKINEEFTLKCYQYSKNSIDKNLFNKISLNNNTDQEYNSEYFPLPIVTLKEQKEPYLYEIELAPIISDLKNYFNGYIACYKSNIILDVVNTIDRLILPFEYEIFNQIIVSLLSNMLYFNKNTNNTRYIKLIFQENTIICSSDGFQLDQNLLIRFSEKIFNDTANLYILSLGQIFILLKKFRINHLVVRDNYSTMIEVKLNNIMPSNDSSNQKAKIIKLNKFKNV